MDVWGRLELDEVIGVFFERLRTAWKDKVQKFGFVYGSKWAAKQALQGRNIIAQVVRPGFNDVHYISGL